MAWAIIIGLYKFGKILKVKTFDILKSVNVLSIWISVDCFLTVCATRISTFKLSISILNTLYIYINIKISAAIYCLWFRKKLIHLLFYKVHVRRLIVRIKFIIYFNLMCVEFIWSIFFSSSYQIIDNASSTWFYSVLYKTHLTRNFSRIIRVIRDNMCLHRIANRENTNNIFRNHIT